MCRNLFCFVLSLLLPCSQALLHAEQQYLITESQLQSIERSLETLEQDRRSWQQQAHSLNQKLEASDQKLEASEKQAGTLNNQLREERERYGRLEQSFNKYETSRSELTARLTGEAAAERQEKERYRGESSARLVVIIALAGAWLLFLGYKVYRIFRQKP